jgi:hypothetical protein
MIGWKLNYKHNDTKVNIQDFETIYMTYMNKVSNLCVDFPDTFMIFEYHKSRESRIESNDEFFSFKHSNPPLSIFDEAIVWIPKELGKYWGNSYVQTDMYNRPFYSTIISKKWSLEGSVSSMNRLKEMKLLDLYGIRTMDDEDDIQLLAFNSDLKEDYDFISLEEATKYEEFPAFEEIK